MAFDWKALNDRADAVLEECAHRRLGLEGTFARFLPAMCAALGACAARVETTDEAGRARAFEWGRGATGARWVRRPLLVSGKPVGRAAFAFATGGSDRERPRAVQTVCEQLDDALFAAQTAAFKQGLVERMGRSLTRSVFDQAIDDAVAALREAVPFKRFALAYLDDEETASGAVRYRVYEGGRCAFHSKGRRHPALEALFEREGEAALEPGRAVVAQALGAPDAAACPLIAGVAKPRAIGAAVVEAPGGLSGFGRDLLQILANAVSQRLVDYNRERRHLSQFFSAEQIDELVRERDYARHLAPRVATIGLLYADINSFTKICERVLRRPDRIGAFVDAFTGEAVRIVWQHGGIFDKMVGDCVIAHFGPPFHRMTRREQAEAALSAAFAIQAYAAKLGRAEFRGLGEKAGLPGLGVAIGLNLCPAAVGLFGPNKDFTAFSSGMNQTARLQSHAGFRETLVMDTVRDAAPRAARFEGPREAAVKNVAKPLRYYRASPLR